MGVRKMKTYALSGEGGEGTEKVGKAKQFFLVGYLWAKPRQAQEREERWLLARAKQKESVVGVGGGEGK